VAVANELTQFMRKLTAVIQSDKLMRIALTTTLSVHKPRIFQKGMDADGGKIGTYSTKKISISKKNQARQTGKTVFEGGYSEYKTAIGKNPGYVNLRNTDQMMMDYGIVVSAGQFGFGFQNDENYNKSQWMEEKYNKDIFDLSKEEEEVLSDTLKAVIERSI
jgi:hypothetical protein